MGESTSGRDSQVGIIGQELAVGDFYGVHHELFGYRGKRHNGWLDQLLKSLAISSSKLREMSCMEAGGAGSKALTLALRASKHVHYIDLSEENTRWMRSYLESYPKKLPITVTHGSILDRHPEFDHTLDLIVCTGVIHHTLDPAKALMHLNAWLKTGGILVLNCYRSGSLYFFWAYIIRELIELVDTDYTELAKFIDLYDFSLRKLETMDDALVPIMHPTDVSTIRHDLKKLGFRIVQDEDDAGPYHSTTKPMLHFTAKKVSTFDGSADELRYHTGINQLALDYGQNCQALVDDFSRFKERLSRQNDRKTQVILAVFAITRIFNESQEIDKGLWRRLLHIQRTKDASTLLTRSSPRDHFYRNVRRYMLRILDGVQAS
jgi:SAM-dependent methyltransferase